MGMFDNLICRYPLPDAPLGIDKYTMFQTKDTPVQYLANYVIREDGTLWQDDKEQVKLTHEVRFYELSDDEEWTEYSAYFVDGVLSQIHLVEHSTWEQRELKREGK